MSTSRQVSSSSSTAAAGALKSHKKFTAKMQERQARNKNPKTGLANSEDEDEEDENASTNTRKSSSAYSGAVAEDDYEAEERRRWASSVLDSPELLMMHAQSRNDSIPGTRYYFTKMLCGYEDAPKKKEKKRERASGDTWT